MLRRCRRSCRTLDATFWYKSDSRTSAAGLWKKIFIARLYEHPPLKGQFRIFYASQDRLARSPYASPCWLGCNCLGWKCAGNRDRKYIRTLWRRTAAVRRARGEPRLVSKRTSQTPFEARGSVVSSRRIFHNMSGKSIADRRLRILPGTHASQHCCPQAENIIQNCHCFFCILILRQSIFL